MPNDNLKSYLHLHLIVFIWGFTAVLGKLISLTALDLVWYRMVFALVFVGLFLFFSKQGFKISTHHFFSFFISGIVIAAHWYTFYEAIKVSNISVTLACLSTGAFFTSLLEPIFFNRKIVLYEVVLGIFVIVGIGVIFSVDTHYIKGILLALLSAFLSASFSIINGKFAKDNDPVQISFYELLGGVFFISIYILFVGGFTKEFFSISMPDLFWLIILASVCTAYAFSASVKVMKFLSPYTVMLTINLEPIYGIILAILIFENSEKMNPMFYLGALIILSTVLLNGYLKNQSKKN